MKTLKELGLTDDEIDFVNRVYENPCCKMGKIDKWIDDGSEYGTSVNFWENPEKLGVIECVGSYKWKPTSKVKMQLLFNDSNEADV